MSRWGRAATCTGTPPTRWPVAHIIFNVFFMLATTAIVANVVARDTQTGFGPMIQSTRITKSAYLYGRFFGAFAAVALCYLSIAIGTLLGTIMPWVDPETLGRAAPRRLSPTPMGSSA
jgi:ABC-2 type transport system permease protein